MVHGPQFPGNIGPQPEPFKPESEEKTPTDPDLLEKIDEVKEALQDVLKAEEKLLGEIYKNVVNQIHDHPENGQNLAEDGNKKISDHVDHLFSNLKPGAKQQLKDIGGEHSAAIITHLKNEMTSKHHVEPEEMRVPMSSDEQEEKLSDIEKGVQNTYGADANLANVGNYSSDLESLIEAFKKAPSALKADVIFQQIELSLENASGTSQSGKSPYTSIEQAFDDFRDNKRFTGTVLVVQNGKTIFNQACGMANDTTPNGLDTTYRWESVTKVITATATIKLNEMGLIDLNAQVTDYLPEYRGSPGLSGITIKQLLNYTSGFPGLPAKMPPIWKKHPPTSLKEVIVYLATQPRGPSGGDPVPTNPAYQYSDTAYNLLGYLIDRVTASLPPDMNSCSKFVQKEIFDPAGMTTARMPDTAAADLPEAEGHDFNGNPIDPHDLLFRLGTGNAYGSAKDLYQFDQALTNGMVISKSDVAKMQNDMYGWFGNTSVVPGQQDYEKGGSMSGGESFYYRIPGTDTTIIIMRNKDPQDHNNPEDRSEYLAESIAQILASNR